MYGTAVCTSQNNICRHRTKSADVIRQKFTLSSGQHCPISSTRLKKGARQMKLFISFHDQLRTATLDTKLEATWGNMRQLWESIANCFGLFIKNSLAVNLVKSCKITMVSHFSVFCLWWLKTCQTLLSDEALGSRDCTKCLQQASLKLGPWSGSAVAVTCPSSPCKLGNKGKDVNFLKQLFNTLGIYRFWLTTFMYSLVL